MKKFQRNLTLMLGCLFCSALLSTAGASTARAEEKALPITEPVYIYGTIHKENDRFVMSDIQGDTVIDQLVLNVSDSTRILDAVNGYPVSKENIKDGETVYAYISHAMTMSLPPQSHAEMIICGVPAGFEAPAYETVESITFDEHGSSVVKTARGKDYYIDASSVLLPYLTRNIVTAQDLTKGRTFLVWKTPIGATGEHAAAKIVMFPNSVEK